MTGVLLLADEADVSTTWRHELECISEVGDLVPGPESEDAENLGRADEPAQVGCAFGDVVDRVGQLHVQWCDHGLTKHESEEAGGTRKAVLLGRKAVPGIVLEEYGDSWVTVLHLCSGSGEVTRSAALDEPLDQPMGPRVAVVIVTVGDDLEVTVLPTEEVDGHGSPFQG